MAKSNEQKAAEVLIAAHHDRLWNPRAFVSVILSAPLPIQWEILRTVFVLVKEWRKQSDPQDPNRNFSDYIDYDADLQDAEQAVDLGRWD